MTIIAVCTPARDMVHTQYAYCLVNMVAYHACNTDDRIDLKIMQGTLIPVSYTHLTLPTKRIV